MNVVLATLNSEQPVGRSSVRSLPDPALRGDVASDRLQPAFEFWCDSGLTFVHLLSPVLITLPNCVPALRVQGGSACAGGPADRRRAGGMAGTGHQDDPFGHTKHMSPTRGASSRFLQQRMDERPLASAGSSSSGCSESTAYRPASSNDDVHRRSRTRVGVWRSDPILWMAMVQKWVPVPCREV